tara:strand:- start:2883 stop:3311 length:429 start_codon:yes stop_codon:yes gene_type:complete
MNAVEKWYEVMKSNNLDLLDNLLADDVIFYSPVVFTPQKGKEITKMYLMAAEGVFGSNQNQDRNESNEDKSSKFKYTKEIIGETSALLEFETEMEGIYINGVDILSWNKEEKITEFKVLVRPLQAVNMLHQKMQAMLENLKK